MDHKIILVAAFTFMAGWAPSHRSQDVNATPQAQEHCASVPFEQLAELARQAGLTPMPLGFGPNP